MAYMNKQIFAITKNESLINSGELDAGITGPGWYYWDETWCNASGPFNTYNECKVQLDNYLEELNGK